MANFFNFVHILMASTVFYYFCSLCALGIALANSNSKCSDYIVNHACFGMIVERVVGSDSEYTVYSCSCLPLFFLPLPR